jgi:predicted nucleic acid-binding protein
MIVVDSSVWIDYFRGSLTPQTECLDTLLSSELLAVGDVILTEVLQGFSSERDYNQARKLMTSLDVIDIGGQDIALAAARNFRTLRALGVTVRKTIDTLIATCCIENDFALLYSDRDFEPFARHLGLRSALVEHGGAAIFTVQQASASYR